MATAARERQSTGEEAKAQRTAGWVGWVNRAIAEAEGEQLAPVSRVGVVIARRLLGGSSSEHDDIADRVGRIGFSRIEHGNQPHVVEGMPGGALDLMREPVATKVTYDIEGEAAQRT